MTGDSSAPRIRSIGAYVPTRREPNFEMAERLGFTREFLETKMGVLQRSAKASDETTTDLCVRAFESLRDRISLDVQSVQLLVVVTQHPEYKVPHTSALVHNRLGLAKPCMTFDISQGCAGYTHGVAVMSGVMQSSHFECGVLITCDPYSDKVDPNDKDTALLFGDAATATCFTRSGDGYRVADSNFGTLPNSYQCLLFENRLKMEGGSVFKYAVQETPPSLRMLLERNQLDVTDIDLFLLHQGSKYLVEYIARKMGIPPDKAPFEAADYGNTVSSSIPLMLQRHIDDRGSQTIVLSGFGVGFSWGNNLLQRV